MLNFLRLKEETCCLKCQTLLKSFNKTLFLSSEISLDQNTKLVIYSLALEFVKKAKITWSTRSYRINLVVI